MKRSSVQFRAAAPLALAAALLTIGSAHAGVILSDGFEGGQNFGSAGDYGGTGSILTTAEARTGASALMMDNDPVKEAVLYTLTDVYQIGRYDVTFYVKRATGLLGGNYSLLTYNYANISTSPVLDDYYIQDPALTDAYTQISLTATLLAGDPALGASIQLMIDQSRGGAAGSARIFVDDLTITYTPAAVPEPASYSLTLAGLACLCFSMLRSRKRA